MLVTMFLIACAAQVFIEVYVNSCFPLIKRWQMQWRWFNLLWSIGLSVLIGMVFPAAGLVMFCAAIASTVILWPYYATMRTKHNFVQKRRSKNSII